MRTNTLIPNCLSKFFLRLGFVLHAFKLTQPTPLPTVPLLNLTLFDELKYFRNRLLIICKTKKARSVQVANRTNRQRAMPRRSPQQNFPSCPADNAVGGQSVLPLSSLDSNLSLAAEHPVSNALQKSFCSQPLLQIPDCGPPHSPS